MLSMRPRTFPSPRSSSVISTPSSCTFGSRAPESLAMVGRMSRVLASSWVTPGGKHTEQTYNMYYTVVTALETLQLLISDRLFESRVGGLPLVWSPRTMCAVWECTILHHPQVHNSRRSKKQSHNDKVISNWFIFVFNFVDSEIDKRTPPKAYFCAFNSGKAVCGSVLSCRHCGGHVVAASHPDLVL